MGLGNEKLDVYRLSLRYVGWGFQRSTQLQGANRVSRDQWLRAGQSIPLNIAEEHGKSSAADRRRFFELARGSASVCAAVQDVLVDCNVLEEKESAPKTQELDRVVIKLSRLGKSDYIEKESQADYLEKEDDFDFDFDPDFEYSSPSDHSHSDP